MDQLPELTQQVVKAAVLLEGGDQYLLGTPGRTKLEISIKIVEAGLQPGSKNITPSTEHILIMCITTHIETHGYRICKGSPVWKEL